MNALLRRILLVAALLAPFGLPGAAAAVDRPDPTRFESEIRAFEVADSTASTPRGAVVFYGSSSLRMWHPRLAADFPQLTVVGRGFGGSTMGEAVHFLPRAVAPLAPRAVVLYEGDNDIEMGLTPDQVMADFDTLLARLWRATPDARVYVIAIKPSGARWERWPAMRETNRRFAERCRRDRKRLAYVDVATPMLGKDGQARPELFLDDRLHLNAAGYDLWRDIVGKALQREREFEKAG
jgi:lysophospholipase L1-like esterase